MEIALIKSYTNKPWRSPQTYQMIEDGLRKKWHVNSICTHNTDELYNFFTQMQHEYGEPPFAVNVAEYLDEENKEGFLPALFEEWNIPFLGSSAETTEIELNKVKTKELLNEHDVATPRYFVANCEDANIRAQAAEIGYPLLVKPVAEGGHIGIDEDSIVHDNASLERAVQRIFTNHDQPALVEEFLTGCAMREFTVGIIDSDPRLFTSLEIDFEHMEVDHAILSYEVVQNDLERVKLIDDVDIQAEITDLAARTFDALGAHDYSRIDLRMNHNGCYVLEINTMPGLGPYSFLPAAAKDDLGLSYHELLHMLVTNSMKRQQLT